jgi:CRP/FNR family cyclic AMP-dependent transcriptional regulator
VTTLDRGGRAGFLSGVPLFDGLSTGELRDLADVTRSERVKQKSELFHKGDSGSDLYVVVEGKLKALTTSLEGDDVVFNIHGPGDLIGEIGMLAELPRTATVTALEPCVLLALSRRDLLGFLRAHPDVAIEMLAFVTRRLAHLSELVEDTLFLNLPVRLAKKFVHYASIYGDEIESGDVRINLKLSQEEWGDLVGATRESINKQIAAWKDEGIVSTDAGHILIHSPEVLEKLAGCVID